MERPRLDPIAAVVMLLAVLALAVYLWLEGQKSPGDLHPTGWFVSGLAVGVVLTGYACVSSASRGRVALAGAGLLLVLMAPAATVSLSVDTSRPGALFRAYGIPLATAGVLAVLRAWIHRPWRRATTFAAVSMAAAMTVTSIVAAAEEATRGEGEGGTAHGKLTFNP